jgi:hypothetical protein
MKVRRKRDVYMSEIKQKWQVTVETTSDKSLTASSVYRSLTNAQQLGVDHYNIEKVVELPNGPVDFYRIIAEHLKITRPEAKQKMLEYIYGKEEETDSPTTAA